MTSQCAQDIQLLLSAYAAFNTRDIDAALALMTDDVTWPRAFKGGVVQGPAAIRAYWKEQWAEVDPQVEPVGFYPDDEAQILVEVHQVVHDLTGTMLADELVGHRFTIRNGLIAAMELSLLPSAETT